MRLPPILIPLLSCSLLACADGTPKQTHTPSRPDAGSPQVEQIVQMEPVAQIPIPSSLGLVTGVTWQAQAELFLATTQDGKVALFDGKSYELRVSVNVATEALIDINSQQEQIVALSASGQAIYLKYQGEDQLEVLALDSTHKLSSTQGIALHPQSGQTLFSVDSDQGPQIWTISEQGPEQLLQLQEAYLKRSDSFSIFGAEPVVVKRDSAQLFVFKEDGTPSLRLKCDGMKIVTGVTTRDGTIIASGISEDNQMVFSAYNLQNEEQINPNPVEGPAQLASILTAAAEHSLPQPIRQPSGIAWDAQSKHWLLSTDQGEFFALAEDLSHVASFRDIPGFVQGEVEDIHLLGLGRAGVVSESGNYIPFTYDGHAWQPGTIVENQALDFEVSAFAVDYERGRFYYIANSGPGKRLVVTDAQGQALQEHALDTQTVGLENFDVYTVAALVFHQGSLYLLSEQYSSVFKLSPEGVFEAGWGLDDAAEASAMTIFDGKLWVAFDHEDSAPTPNMKSYLLP